MEIDATPGYEFFQQASQLGSEWKAAFKKSVPIACQRLPLAACLHVRKRCLVFIVGTIWQRLPTAPLVAGLRLPISHIQATREIRSIYHVKVRLVVFS